MVSFDPAVLGNAPQTRSAFIGNNGTAPLVIDTTRTTITGPFSITGTTCNSGPIKTPSNNVTYGCDYTVNFHPTTAGAATGTLTLYTNDPASPKVIFTLSGTALTSYPAPTITKLAVPTLSLDNGPTDLRIIGTNFFPTTTVLVNGISVSVKSESNTSITFTVDPSILGTMGEFPVQAVNPAPGGSSNIVKLTTYHLLNLTSTNAVYEPNSKLLYVAIPATSSSNPNTILPVNPVTGAYGTPIPVGNNPTRLALSDDGHYLYVGFYYTYSSSGQLQRIDLKTGSVDHTFSLPGSSDGIIDMHVVPGAPQLLVASLSRNGSPSENGVALFNDAGVVQYIANDYDDHNYTLDNFTFTSEPTYYGYPIGTSFFNSASVTDSGITPITRGGVSCCDQPSGSIIVSDGTLLYTNSGEVWDPKTQKLLGRYDNNLFYEAGIVADATAKRTFMLKADYQPDNGNAYPAVISYDPSTFKLADTIYFNLPNSPLSLVRWGSDGFAFLSTNTNTGDWTNPYTESQLVLFRSSLATPGGTAAVPVFTLSSASLAFGNVPTGNTAQQTLTLQNTGNIALVNISVGVSGQNATDFATTTTCGTNVAVNGTCTITISFQPTDIGDKSAAVTVNSTGATAQSVSITGTSVASDFVLPEPTGSSTASVPAGQPANFNFTINPYGAFTGTITMSCSNLPVYAACSFSPASFTLGSTSTPVSLSISTQQTTQASIQPRHALPVCLPS